MIPMEGLLRRKESAQTRRGCVSDSPGERHEYKRYPLWAGDGIISLENGFLRREVTCISSASRIENGGLKSKGRMDPEIVQ